MIQELNQWPSTHLLLNRTWGRYLPLLVFGDLLGVGLELVGGAQVGRQIGGVKVGIHVLAVALVVSQR